MENVDLSTVSREQLEEFVTDSMSKLDRLEDAVKTLASQVKIDPEVIEGWRNWIDIVDEERKKWADTATRLDGEKRAEKHENARLFQAVKDLTVVFERIHNIAKRNKGDKPRMLDLKRAIDSICEQAAGAMADAYEEVLGYPEDVDGSLLHRLHRPDRIAAIGGNGYAADPPELPQHPEDPTPRPEDAQEAP